MPPTTTLSPLCRSTLAALVWLATAAVCGAAILDVGIGGPGAGCEAFTLQEAIDLADNSSAVDEIRLTANTTFIGASTLHLTDWGPTGKGELTIRGGFSSCTDTTPDSTSPSDISNGGSGAVVEIDTTGANTSLVTFDNIRIILSSGRGLVVQGNSTVDLLGTGVRFNDGGGISVESGASVYLDADSFATENGPTATGGGIHCTGATSEVLLEAFVGVNEATSGGGLAVTNGCEAVLYPGARVYDNTASVGAGIYAESGALVSALSGDVVIDYNDAASSGGAIAATGAGTQVLLAGTAISLNTSGFWGAGIYASSSAFVALGAHGTPCAGYLDCPGFLSYNTLTGIGEDGSAAVAANGAEVRLLQTIVGHNDIPESAPGGSVLYSGGAGSLIRTESTEVAFNFGPRSAFHAEGGGDLRIAMTTTAHNYSDTSPATLSEGVRLEGTGSQAWINTSLMYPVAAYHVSGGASFVSVDCVITSTTSGLPGGATFISTLDPLYTDLATGDLRPLPGSPAIDYCDSVVFTPTVPGLDGRLRGHDHPLDPNGLPGVGGPASIQDLGALEVWEIFADGFEGGNTNNWS